VLAAVGTTAAAFEPDALDVAINGVQVCRAGASGDDRDLVDLSGRDVRIVVDLHAGDATATVWTNDLTGRTSTRTRRTPHDRRPPPPPAGTRLPKAAALVEALPWLKRFSAAPSSSSTAGTR
jgi:hypothetical protein